MNPLISKLKAARLKSVPLIAINTPDPAATIRMVSAAVNGNYGKVVWDAVKGFAPLDKAGAAALSQAMPTGMSLAQTVNLTEALLVAEKLPAGAVVFIQGAHRQLGNDAAVQAIANLRDPFKSDRRTLILLGPDFQLPADLANDVVVMDEPLPTEDELRTIVRELYEAAELKPPTQAVEEKAVAALLGLAVFPAEQAGAMSLTPQGFDMAELWTRKIQTIEQTKGLSVYRGTERFEDIGGLDNVKEFLGRVLKGRDAPRAICFIDEIDKAFSAVKSDSTGVSQDQLDRLLVFMENKRAAGVIFVSPAGSGKSLVAKAAGNSVGIPTVSLDLGGMKAVHVGESEQNLRVGLRVLSAISGDRVLFIATCNQIGVLPPELRRRFTLGTFFFDLPSAEERSKIWDIHLTKYGMISTPEGLPDDHNWTGAEIRNCVEMAWRLNVSLKEAAAYIVPVAEAAAATVEELRRSASGIYINASAKGKYVYDGFEAPVVTAPMGRKLN